MSGSSQTTKSTSTTSNPYAISQFQSAQSSLPSSYSALTGSQIQGYMNPYTQSVIDAQTAYSNQQQQQALNANNDAATRAGAFGGDRASVANALTEGQYDLNNQMVAANLNSQNYSQAMQTAATQNAAQNQYPLVLQQLLGQLADQTQKNTSGSSSSSELGFNLSGALNPASGSLTSLAFA